MNAFKITARPDTHRRVIIELPADFEGSEVEIIVLQSEKMEKPSFNEGEPNEFQKKLLEFPVATDEDIEFIEEKRRHFNSWK